MKATRNTVLGVLFGDLGGIMFYAGAILLFVAWAMHPHKDKTQPLLTVAPVPHGNTFADQAAEKVGPALIEFVNAEADVRDMVVVVTGTDNSSRVMTLTRTDAQPLVLYRMGATLLEKGADNLAPPAQHSPKEEHAL